MALAAAESQLLSFRLRRKVLPSVIIIMVTLFLIGVGSSFRLHEQDIINSIAYDLKSVAGSVQQEQKDEAALLAELGRQLAKTDAFIKAINNQNKPSLRRLVEPIYRQWRNDYAIDHLHIYGKNTDLLLQLDAIQGLDDEAKHGLLKQSQISGKVSSGIEVSRAGIIVMTSIIPVVFAGKQIGLIEISADVSKVINRQHIPVLGNEYLMTIYRQGLPPKTEHYLAQQAEKGAVKAYPALFTVAGGTKQALAKEAQSFMSGRQHNHFEVKCDTDGLFLNRCVGFVPILNAAGNEIGDMVVVRNVSDRMMTLAHELAIHASVAAALLLILLLTLGMVLGRTERRMLGISSRVLEAKAELKRSNEALRSSEQRARMLMDSAAEGIYGLDRNGICIFANAACARLLGYDDPNELTGKRIHSLIHHSHADGRHYDEEECRIQDSWRLGQRIHVDNEYFWHRDGQSIAVEYWAQPMVDDGGLNGSVVTFIDISKRIRQEEELHKLSQAVAQAGESVLITDRNGTIEYVNPAFERLTGYSAAEAIGRNPSMLKSSAQDPAHYKQLWETISKGEVWSGSMIDRRKDGSFYPVLMSVAPIRSRTGEITHYVALQQDITDRQELEQQLIQAQKMEAIGTLVGGIAHDFNNILSGIAGNAFMGREGCSDAAAKERMENIEKLSFRGADMIRQLLVFARKDMVRMKKIPLGIFLKEAMKLSASLVPENISLQLDAAKAAMPVQGDATQLQQMLMNLLSNARDAVESVPHPKIRVTLERLEADDPGLQSHAVLAGQPAAHIAVSDNGIGMPEEIRSKVFEPFFTTKEVDKGTGLGLSMVYGAVQTHQGIIELESERGEGTTVHVYLPLAEEAAEEEQELLPKAVRGAGQTILVVDDETGLRRTMADVLKSIGYRTLEAEDGVAGVEMLKRHLGKVALAMLDVVMPEMGGVEAARQMRAIRSDLPLLLVTGYDRQELFDEDALPEGSIVMTKPVKVEELSQNLQRLLKDDESD